VTGSMTNYSHNSRQINEYISLEVHARGARSYVNIILMVSYWSTILLNTKWTLWTSLVTF
jgi:hypothetical protein